MEEEQNSYSQLRKKFNPPKKKSRHEIPMTYKDGVVVERKEYLKQKEEEKKRGK